MYLMFDGCEGRNIRRISFVKCILSFIICFILAFHAVSVRLFP